MVAKRIRWGEGVASKESFFAAANPSPIIASSSTELPSPARGEGASNPGAPVVRRANYVSAKLSSPSFSIEVTTLSPGLSHTCLSLG